jgi:hypothetical protein
MRRGGCWDARSRQLGTRTRVEGGWPVPTPRGPSNSRPSAGAPSAATALEHETHATRRCVPPGRGRAGSIEPTAIYGWPRECGPDCKVCKTRQRRNSCTNEASRGCWAISRPQPYAPPVRRAARIAASPSGMTDRPRRIVGLNASAPSPRQSRSAPHATASALAMVARPWAMRAPFHLSHRTLMFGSVRCRRFASPASRGGA